MMQININANWEWYENTNVFRLFYHCLLHTNLEDKRYCGKEIKAGQFVSSITRISAETGLTESQVRTALKKLKDTGYISTKSTNKYTIYTVIGYQEYIDCVQVAETTTEENKVVENGTKMEQTDEKAKETCEKSKENCEKSNKKAINECFERLWKQYPNKRGKGQVSDTKKKTLYEIGEEKIERALKRYLDDLSKDSSWRKPQNGSTFFNSGYVDYLDENYEKPPEPKPQRNPASILECERDYDFDNLEQQLLEKQFGGNT
jgi:DNA-binding transcriptional regulator YhcF (GntR family)